MKDINPTLLGTRLACSHLKHHYDPVQRLCTKCGQTDKERSVEESAAKYVQRLAPLFPKFIPFDEDVGILGHQDFNKPTETPGSVWPGAEGHTTQEGKISLDEVGCQVDLVTGQHLGDGQCKGTCRGSD